MADHDKVLCVQVFGLTEVEPERYAFGFAQTYALPPDVTPSRLEDTLRESRGGEDGAPPPGVDVRLLRRMRFGGCHW